MNKVRHIKTVENLDLAVCMRVRTCFFMIQTLFHCMICPLGGLSKLGGALVIFLRPQRDLLEVQRGRNKVMSAPDISHGQLRL